MPQIRDLAGNPLARLAYANDFESVVGTEWSTALTGTSDYSTSFLGEFSNDTATLTLGSPPAHAAVELVWDLLIIDSWDGGSDRFGFSVAGRPAAEFDYSFCVFNYAAQSFPRTPDEALNFYNGSWTDNVYRNVSYGLVDAGAQLQIGFYGHNLEGVSNEGWGLDNLKVYLTDAQGGSQSASFTIERSGPKVIGTAPAAVVSDPFNYLDVTFNEPINPATFTRASASLNGPGGLVNITGVTHQSGNTWRIAFVTQAQGGTYTLTVGPGITDRAGNLMNQNGNDVNGESDDAYVRTVELRIADLVPVINSSPLTAAWGQSITVSWTVNNPGTGYANQDWTDAVYLSGSATAVTADATLLGMETIASQTPLAPGGSYTVTRTFVIPASAARGSRFLVVVTDKDAVQIQTNKADDLTATALTITAPNLVVGDIAWTALHDGQAVTLTARIDNLGDGATVGAFVVRFEVDGQFLGRQTIAAPVAGGGSATVQQT